MDLQLVVGKETTEDERSYIEEVFAERFNVIIDDGLMRLSEVHLLPLAIQLFIDSSVSGAVWDGLKYTITKLFSGIDEATKRESHLTIRTNDKEAVITKHGQVVYEKEKTVEISSVDELIRLLREKNT